MRSDAAAGRCGSVNASMVISTHHCTHQAAIGELDSIYVAQSVLIFFFFIFVLLDPPAGLLNETSLRAFYNDS